jgi:hypothetical protein
MARSVSGVSLVAVRLTYTGLARIIPEYLFMNYPNLARRSLTACPSGLKACDLWTISSVIAAGVCGKDEPYERVTF